MTRDVPEEQVSKASHTIFSDDELLQSALADYCLTNDDNEALSYIYKQSRPDVREFMIRVFRERLFEYADDKDLF